MQFISYAVIPQEPTKTVSTIRVACAYEQNVGTAEFDNISLVQETAQSMTYDDNGLLVSVTSTGLGTDVDTYSAARCLIKRATAGYGTYFYEYADSANSYRVSSMTNNLITEDYDYDTYGNLEKLTISGTGNRKIVTSSTYTSDGNRVASVTDAAGNTVTYAYDTADSQMLGLPTSVTAPNGTVTTTTYDAKNRVTQTSVANAATLGYTYSNGYLSTITRTGGSTEQTYSFTYDAFGNVLSTKVGDRLLAFYEYAEGNGYLIRQTDGNGDSVTYTYDNLSRVKTATYSDGLVLNYVYTGEGNLYSITATENGVTTKYIYGYDSLGRLISSERKDNGTSALRTRQGYDNVNRLISQIWQLGSDTYTENFSYNSTKDGTLNTHTTATGQTLTMGYDGLRRLSTVTGGIYGKTYTYRNTSSTRTTTQVASVVYDLPTDQTYAYTYDSMGNIATYTDANGTVTYTYDGQNQLLSASDGTTTYSYTYDTVGNILTGNGHTYTYGDTDWKDLLTAVDGEAITYDAIGNPTSYYNGTRWTFAWEDGKELSTASDGTNSISYTYDADGIRTSKTVNGVKHTYYYAGGKLLRETYGDTTLDFFYDSNGHPYSLKYNDTVYYYITNLQGDVMQIVDASGNPVATYSYDPYGNILTATGDLASVNPLRYRGYYYDAETGLYYVSSRYYDPEIGRWINADALVSTGQGLLGNNMFAYCLNNPVNYTDSTGNCACTAASNLANDSMYSFACNCCGGGSGRGSGFAVSTQSAASILASVVALGTVFAVGSKQKENSDNKKILADVKAKQQQENAKLYQLAYVNTWGMLVRVGKKMTFTEALAALGISGAVNSVAKIYEYDRSRSSTAQRSLEHLGTGNWGIYSYSQSAAKALAFVFGCTAPPEIHGWGMYAHYHDSTHTFHIWFGGVQYR